MHRELNPRVEFNMIEVVVNIFNDNTLQREHTKMWYRAPRSLVRAKTVVFSLQDERATEEELNAHRCYTEVGCSMQLEQLLNFF